MGRNSATPPVRLRRLGGQPSQNAGGSGPARRSHEGAPAAAGRCLFLLPLPVVLSCRCRCCRRGSGALAAAPAAAAGGRAGRGARRCRRLLGAAAAAPLGHAALGRAGRLAAGPGGARASGGLGLGGCAAGGAGAPRLCDLAGGQGRERWARWTVLEEDGQSWWQVVGMAREGCLTRTRRSQPGPAGRLHRQAQPLHCTNQSTPRSRGRPGGGSALHRPPAAGTAP